MKLNTTVLIMLGLNNLDKYDNKLRKNKINKYRQCKIKSIVPWGKKLFSSFRR